MTSARDATVEKVTDGAGFDFVRLLIGDESALGGDFVQQTFVDQIIDGFADCHVGESEFRGQRAFPRQVVTNPVLFNLLANVLFDQHVFGCCYI